jgi:hypothetical protein
MSAAGEGPFRRVVTDFQIQTTVQSRGLAGFGRVGITIIKTFKDPCKNDAIDVILEIK